MNGTYNVSGTTTVSGGTATVAGPLTNLGNALSISGGTLNVGSNAATVTAFTQTGGELNGSGTLTVIGPTTGRHEPDYVIELLRRDAERFGDDVCSERCNIQFDDLWAGWWSHAASWAGPARRAESSVSISLNSTNPNTGASDAGSGTLTILNGATFTDATTGGLTISTINRGAGDDGTAAAVNNAGTFIKSGSGTSTISTLFNNTGIVNVQAGTLNLSGGGADVGAVYGGAGTVEFGGGTRTLDVTSSITGNVLFAGGAATFTTINGGVGTGLMTITGGTATFNGTVSTGALTQSGGELNGSGTLTMTGPAVSNFSGGTQSGSGTTFAQNGATFSSTIFGLDGGRTLKLGGTSTTSGSSVSISLNSTNPNTGASDAGSGTLTILNGATFTDATTGGLTISTINRGAGDDGTAAAVNNAGTFIKSGSGTSTISTLFNNTGTVNVQSWHAELERRRHRCRGGVRRRRHRRIRRRHADAGCHIEHYRQCAVRRRRDDVHNHQWRRRHWLDDDHRWHCHL